MILVGVVTVGRALGDRIGWFRMFRQGTYLIIVGAAITFLGGLANVFPIVLVGHGLKDLGTVLFLPATTACCWTSSP